MSEHIPTRAEAPSRRAFAGERREPAAARAGRKWLPYMGACRFAVVTVALSFFASPVATAAEAAPAHVWTATTWNGENACALETTVWRAVVSVERGRLVEFGLNGGATPLLFAPETRDTPLGWGGHRVWLGPQLTWPAVWPPPPQWESSAAAAVRAEGARLELDAPDAGDGWPRFTRIYELADGKLACRVRIAGGTRPVQIIQILQTPATTEASFRLHEVDETYPRGFVLLPPLAVRKHAVAAQEIPPQMRLVGGGAARLRHTGTTGKFGFPAQTIVARNGVLVWQIAREPLQVAVVDEPDDGFNSQIWLGGAEVPIVELEQLSPRFAAGAEAEFSIVIGFVD